MTRLSEAVTALVRETRHRMVIMPPAFDWFSTAAQVLSEAGGLSPDEENLLKTIGLQTINEAGGIDKRETWFHAFATPVDESVFGEGENPAYAIVGLVALSTDSPEIPDGAGLALE